MALLQGFNRSVKKRQSVHTSTTWCEFSVFLSPNKERYLQLDTIGSQGREHKGEVSQTIQFDEARAAELLSIIRQTFPALD